MLQTGDRPPLSRSFPSFRKPLPSRDECDTGPVLEAGSLHGEKVPAAAAFASCLHTGLYARPHSSFVIFPAMPEFSWSGLVFAECFREPDPPLTGNTVKTEAGDCPGEGRPMQETEVQTVTHLTGQRRPGASRAGGGGVNKNKIKKDMNAPSSGDRARGHPNGHCGRHLNVQG